MAREVRGHATGASFYSRARSGKSLVQLMAEHSRLAGGVGSGSEGEEGVGSGRVPVLAGVSGLRSGGGGLGRARGAGMWGPCHGQDKVSTISSLTNLTFRFACQQGYQHDGPVRLLPRSAPL